MAGTEEGVPAIYCLYLLWHRCLQDKREDLESTLPGNMQRLLIVAYAGCRQRATTESQDDWENPLLDEVTSCCLWLILRDEFEANSGNVVPILARLFEPFAEPVQMLDAIHRLQAIAGLALLVGEIRRQASLVDSLLARIVQLLSNDERAWEGFLTRWKIALDPALAFQFGLQESLIMKYHSYFLAAWDEIGDLPIVTGDRPWQTDLDHPSEFVRRHSIHRTISPDECVEEFMSRLEQWRPRVNGDDQEGSGPDLTQD